MTIDETIADLRALLGDPEVVSVDIDVALALADEVERLRAIIEGRTTPPTAEELAAHGAVGGAWIVSGPFPALPMVCGPAETVAVIEESARILAPGALRWRAVDAHGRPCAWPGDVP